MVSLRFFPKTNRQGLLAAARLGGIRFFFAVRAAVLKSILGVLNGFDFECVPSVK
jgi:hypothetical protein